MVTTRGSCRHRLYLKAGVALGDFAREAYGSVDAVVNRQDVLEEDVFTGYLTRRITGGGGNQSSAEQGKNGSFHKKKLGRVVQ